MKHLVLIVSFFLCSIVATAWGQVAVIVHKSNPITSFSSLELKNIFSGDITKFSNGTNIVIVTYKSDTETRKKFYGFIGKKYSECQANLLKRIMNDGLKPPISFENDDDAAAFVAKTPGAIGFVQAGNTGNAKAVIIDGKKYIE